MDIPISRGVLTIEGTYKPGDPPPISYLDWHAWAMVQHTAGLRQVRCDTCSLWKFPQEISDRPNADVRDQVTGEMYARRPVCLVCSENAGATDA